MFVLFGIPHDPFGKDEPVAFFTTRKRAEEYVKRSRLKRKTNSKTFKEASLLGPYYEATVGNHVDLDILAVNPEIDF